MATTPKLVAPTFLKIVAKAISKHNKNEEKKIHNPMINVTSRITTAFLGFMIPKFCKHVHFFAGSNLCTDRKAFLHLNHVVDVITYQYDIFKMMAVEDVLIVMLNTASETFSVSSRLLRSFSKKETRAKSQATARAIKKFGSTWDSAKAQSPKS